jgi:hypothetical protein
MPNVYAVTNVGTRRGKMSLPRYPQHSAFHFFNSNSPISAFSTTPNMIYWNNQLMRANRNRNAATMKHRLINLVGGPPNGEARARIMIHRALDGRLKEIKRHPGDKRFYNKHIPHVNRYWRLLNALGPGNYTQQARINNNNSRINKTIVSLMKRRYEDLQNPTKAQQVINRQSLILKYIRNSKKLYNHLTRLGINTKINTVNYLRTLANKQNTSQALRNNINAFIRSKNALSA